MQHAVPDAPDNDAPLRNGSMFVLVYNLNRVTDVLIQPHSHHLEHLFYSI